ncbi:MAG: polysaccharide deacetylase family protein [Actinobacteria bacterium]|nr:MAG: polysaccharide deacetylase family protein [Actinomycetota bacterium]
MKPVALTFDDGPSRWTPLVLDLLREHEARATFFVIGARVRERPDDVRRIVAEGHELGSHTLTHPRLTEISDDEVRAEITGGLEAIEEVLAERPTLFRAPGFYAERRELAIVEELGLEAVFAHVDPQDWRPERDSHTIFRLVLDELREGVIVDLHDGYPPRPTSSRTDCTPTVEALDHLLPCLQPEGYEAVTVSQLGTPAAP